MLMCLFNAVVSSDDGEGLGVSKNPLEEVTAGLLDSNGEKLPLQAVHLRCKLMDLLCQVKNYTGKMADYYTMQISTAVINFQRISKKYSLGLYIVL